MRIFIGYDSNEVEAYHVLAHSIIKHASAPVSITPLKLSHLPMWRDRHQFQSTEFSFSRFLVPHLSGYQGWSLFMDCDMLITRDITEVFQHANERYSVMCTQPWYKTKAETKFLNQVNKDYERKNWSAFMLFNNAACRDLTPQTVNKWTGLDLHRFKWLDDSQLGKLPDEYNYLVGEWDHWPEDNGHRPPMNLHWTLGGPWFTEYQDAPWSWLWRQYRDEIHAVQMPPIEISTEVEVA